VCVSIDKASFSWGFKIEEKSSGDLDKSAKGADKFKVNVEKFEKEVISDISLQMKLGEHLVVVGQVGCGKSSFLFSVMGETIKTKGDVKVNGSIAYVEQEPFILSDSVKNNILFGQEYNKEKFEAAIHAS